MSKLSDRLRAKAREIASMVSYTDAASPVEWEAADALDTLQVALEEARDALNGAPNTVGLHNQIAHALVKLES